MDTLDVRLKLSNLHCYDEGDGPGSAEPYLWTVFFKIDGDTTSVNSDFVLQGTATVAGTAGNHGDLPNHDVDPGDNVAIPVTLGDFTTQLKPIPLRTPVGDTTHVGGVVGVVTVLMEQDKTPGSAIAQGHAKLDSAVRDALNGLIPTLRIGHEEPSEEEIEAIKDKVGEAVTDAIENDVGIWDWLSGLGNMDDRIASEVFRFSHRQLEAGGVSGIGIRKRFSSEGDWEISGRATAIPVGATTGGLRVALSGVPSTLTTFPVRVSGPGFTRTLNKTTTLTGLLPGEYTITANGFSTGLPNKPTCRIYTPLTGSARRTVVTGEIASASVGYTSEPCGA